ncbi:MAG TPA: hypothetical protein VGK73_15735 [Polyangiaceae bacterium]
MTVRICEECLTRNGTMSICPDGKCRRCGHVADPNVLTVGEIRAIVRAKQSEKP